MCRYQQYRAVSRAIERLRTGKTRLQDGEHDRRGGVVARKGSGKSLTMVFLIRKLRTDPPVAPLQGGGGDRPHRPGAPTV